VGKGARADRLTGLRRLLVCAVPTWDESLHERDTIFGVVG